VTPGLFSRQQVTAITGLSSRQLGYWRKTGLVVPQVYTAGGQAHYSFSDLIALRTAKRLLDAKISLQRIRTCPQSLTRFLPAADRPLLELSLLVTGDGFGTRVKQSARMNA
jgi:DNA-binding transcriptional MerR regulator